jgi:uncharacterized membrane protein
MAEGDKKPDDTRFEQMMGNLLRTGVVLAALVTAAGGVVYLAKRWNEPPPPYGVFPMPDRPAELNSVPGVLEFAFRGRGQGLIQLGVLLLIATPVARVAFSVYAFARQRDRLYVLVTLVVLALLLLSLFSGAWLSALRI